MIDGWFSILVISFISAVGGLAVLLIQSCRDQHDEAFRQSAEAEDSSRLPQ